MLNAEAKRRNQQRKRPKSKESVNKLCKLPTDGDLLSPNWKHLLQTLPKAEKRPASSQPTSKHKAKKRRKINDADPKSADKRSSKMTQEKESSGSKLSKSDIWFECDDMMMASLKGQLAASERAKVDSEKTEKNPLVKVNNYTGLTKAVAMDCEMVGTGPDGDSSILARVSIVNHDGSKLYDKFVKPTEKVTDYRTAVSGVRPSDLKTGEDFKVVQKEVCDLIDKRILVGHAIHNDLQVLFLSHPHKQIRDTSKYRGFRKLVKGGTPSLKKLSELLLGVKVQEGEHSSVQDAQAAMRLYTMHKSQWEADLKAGKPKNKKKKQRDRRKNAKKEQQLN